ncbi:hypothetical protein KFL_000310290 [Klebsormidium nitens]|uniref:Nascent polypeptide-associated complex subunit alpha-like UBA domain-containing protein n=1 Tax=Klebsormidium nitens TaxID=105231 RepID=A0A1Y1HQL2_KLENI|nr:hypothetical protein KFL_000310290 [Klebsormidium nitens]|eukprot:GAQ79479.1 hypothetical protein KFL_000310290 [Klebsormidium nitens]
MSDDPQEAEGNGDPKMASRDVQQQSKALNSITDYVEEKEMDASKVKQAMESINASDAADKQAQRLREKELAAVKVSQSDLDVIVNELELDKKEAERILREHKGDAVAALRSYIQ